MHSLKCKPQKIYACLELMCRQLNFPAQVTLMAKVKLQNSEHQEQEGRRKGENKQSRALQTQSAKCAKVSNFLLKPAGGLRVRMTMMTFSYSGHKPKWDGLRHESPGLKTLVLHCGLLWSNHY